MERLQPVTDLPFVVGALYSRRDDIHSRFRGQERGGIATPTDSEFVFLFTGEAGKQHGYHDFWDDHGRFHYFGEGQIGDMKDLRGNRAIRSHLSKGKRLLMFQMMGHGQPYRFLGEFRFDHAYEQLDVPDREGTLRKAIVFRLVPVEATFDPFLNQISDQNAPKIDIGSTASLQLVEVRSKQSLFKRRLLHIEKQCRMTGIADLRFLRASHIKPWAKCANGDERVDGSNGLLLSPHADFLFDRGWITFEDNGALLRSKELPQGVVERIGLDLTHGRDCGSFFDQQKKYLEFHRNAVFEQSFRKTPDPLSELIASTAP